MFKLNPFPSSPFFRCSGSGKEVGDCVDPEKIEIAKRLLQYWTDRTILLLPMRVCEILKILFLRKSTLPKYIHHHSLSFL